MIGAAIGGRLGDRWGRKRVLVISFTLLGIFSLATMLAYDVGSFVLIRLLCGLGLGAAFPNLIAIAAEAAPASRRATGVGMMFSGTPIGRSEEHTSELQSLMRNSYAVLCLIKKKKYKFK